jgi:type IV pilus assembly protein PilB
MVQNLSQKSTRAGLRLGELLVLQGVLSTEQVDEILDVQRRTARPFGDLAETLFHVDPQAIEKAWIDQYLSFSTEIDLDRQRMDLRVLKVLNRRQAWQFRILPLRHENEELVVATDSEHLKRAVNFAWSRLDEPIYFLIASRPQLEAFLMKHYPWPGVLKMPRIAG